MKVKLFPKLQKRPLLSLKGLKVKTEWSIYWQAGVLSDQEVAF